MKKTLWQRDVENSIVELTQLVERALIEKKILPPKETTTTAPSFVDPAASARLDLDAFNKSRRDGATTHEFADGKKRYAPDSSGND